MNLRDLILEEEQVEILICDSYLNILSNIADYTDDILDIGLLLNFEKCIDVTDINNLNYLTIQTPIVDCLDNILNRLKEIKKNLKNENDYTKESIEVINSDFKTLVKFYEILKKYNKTNYSLTIVGLDDVTIHTISDFKIKNLSLAIKKYKNKRDKFLNLQAKDNFIKDINNVLNIFNKKNVFKNISLNENISIINMDKNKRIIRFSLDFELDQEQLIHIDKDIFLINLIQELEEFNIGWEDNEINVEEDFIQNEYSNIIKISFYKIY